LSGGSVVYRPQMTKRRPVAGPALAEPDASECHYFSPVDYEQDSAASVVQLCRHPGSPGRAAV